MAAVVRLARLAAGVFYRLERVGPPLPAGPLLLVANHPNALLDPAVVWATAGRDVRFLAKSTLFRMPLVGALVRRSGSIPVYRRHDAGEDATRNVEAFAAVARALEAGAAICVFPEGISHATGRLEPLRTGTARMALGAAAVRPAIVPVGLDFASQSVFRSRATAFYGPAVSYDDLLDGAPADPQAAARALTERLSSRLRGLIVEADPESSARVVARVEGLYRRARGLSDAPEERLGRRQLVARGLERLRETDPARYAEIRERLRLYDARLARFGLEDRDVGPLVARRAALRFAVREGLLALGLVPLAAAATLVFSPPFLVTAAVTRGRRALEMRATVKVAVGAVAHVAWIVALSALAARAWGAWGGLAAAVALPASALAGISAAERELAALRAAASWLRARSTPESARRRLVRNRADIAEVLEQARAWLERPVP